MSYEVVDTQPFISLALPEDKRNPSGRPSLELALRDYFDAKYLPQPKIRNGIGQGDIHLSSSFELLQLGFSVETFWAASHWIRKQQVDQLRQATRFCVYTERRVSHQGFLYVISSRLAPSFELIPFARDSWGTDISPLFAFAPEETHLATRPPLRAFTPARISPLPPRPVPQFISS